MKKYVLYGHGGAYNHGAEAIIRTTVDMLKENDKTCKIILSTHFKEQDLEFKLPVDSFIERDDIALKREKESGNQGIYNSEVYRETLEVIDKDTVCLSVGGDNYCYSNWAKWKDIHKKSLEMGAKSVLWSCSIEPNMIDDEMLEVLRTHHIITARESLTYEFLKSKGLNNVKLVSDVAFLLEPSEVNLPNNLTRNNTVAINISPLTARKEISKDILKQNVLELIKYIFEGTDMDVALIPHVNMPMDNDFEYLQEIYTEVQDKSRVSLIGKDYNAKQLKYIIAQCRFGVFARTHATIAAYSSCIPSIAIGYSIKAQGIAKDMSMSKYVVPINQINNRKDLVEKFKILCNEERRIKLTLEEANKIVKERAKNNLVSLNDLLLSEGDIHG